MGFGIDNTNRIILMKKSFVENLSCVYIRCPSPFSFSNPCGCGLYK